MKIIEIKADGDMPQVLNIENTLEACQDIIEGYIEVVMLDDELALVVNEEGKINRLPINRIFIDNKANVVDVICGNVFIVGAGGEEFEDVPENRIDEIISLFNSRIVNISKFRNFK